MDRHDDEERGSEHAAEAVKREKGPGTMATAVLTEITGSPTTVSVFLLVVLIWLAVGFVVHFSRGWELAATAGSPVLSLVLLLVVQHTQNRDDKAIQLKLDELLRVAEGANERMIAVEHAGEHDLGRLDDRYHRHAEKAEDVQG